MKVAMIAPIAWRTPPRHYGPWELVTLTDGSQAHGIWNLPASFIALVLAFTLVELALPFFSERGTEILARSGRNLCSNSGFMHTAPGCCCSHNP